LGDTRLRPTGRTYSAREIAELAQCTREQLCCHEEIQLLRPVREHRPPRQEPRHVPARRDRSSLAL